MAHHGQAQTPTYWHASHKTSACDTCLHHGYVGSKFTLENADGARCIQSGLFRGSSRFIPVKVLRASEGSYAIGIGQISEDADVVAVRKQSTWVHAIRMLMINGSWPDAWSHLFSYWRRTAILWFRRKHTYRGSTGTENSITATGLRSRYLRQIECADSQFARKTRCTRPSELID